jgi:hypothetical protein
LFWSRLMVRHRIGFCLPHVSQGSLPGYMRAGSLEKEHRPGIPPVQSTPRPVPRAAYIIVRISGSCRSPRHLFPAPLCVRRLGRGRQTSSEPRLEDQHVAHFYGTVSGRGRTTASRVGRKNTGLQTVAASWQGAAKVTLYEREPWRGASVSRVLYDGPVGGTAMAKLTPRSPEGLCFHLASMPRVPGSRIAVATAKK